MDFFAGLLGLLWGEDAGGAEFDGVDADVGVADAGIAKFDIQHWLHRQR